MGLTVTLDDSFSKNQVLSCWTILVGYKDIMCVV